MRDTYAELRAAGAEVVAVGTGNPDLARAFVADYGIPYPVLVDGEAAAARAARIARTGFLRMFHPASWAGTRRAWGRGHRIGAAGARVTQLGATFVLGPGARLRYAHRDAHSADHAPLDEIFAALPRGDGG